MDLLEIEDRLTKLLDMVTVPHPLKAPVIAEVTSLRDEVADYVRDRYIDSDNFIERAASLGKSMTEVASIERSVRDRILARRAERETAKQADETPAPTPAAEPESPCLVTLSCPRWDGFINGSRGNGWIASGGGRLDFAVSALCPSRSGDTDRVVLAHRLPDGSWVVPSI